MYTINSLSILLGTCHFDKHYDYLEHVDEEWKNSTGFGSFLILSLVVEVGEIALIWPEKSQKKSIK